MDRSGTNWNIPSPLSFLKLSSESYMTEYRVRLNDAEIGVLRRAYPWARGSTVVGIGADFIPTSAWHEELATVLEGESEWDCEEDQTSIPKEDWYKSKWWIVSPKGELWEIELPLLVRISEGSFRFRCEWVGLGPAVRKGEPGFELMPGRTFQSTGGDAELGCSLVSLSFGVVFLLLHVLETIGWLLVLGGVLGLFCLWPVEAATRARNATFAAERRVKAAAGRTMGGRGK
jgi:hypothetical protein